MYAPIAHLPSANDLPVSSQAMELAAQRRDYRLLMELCANTSAHSQRGVSGTKTSIWQAKDEAAAAVQSIPMRPAGALGVQFSL